MWWLKKVQVLVFLLIDLSALATAASTFTSAQGTEEIRTRVVLNEVVSHVIFLKMPWYKHN